MLLQVMPPTAQQKLSNPDWVPELQGALGKVSEKKRKQAEDLLNDLTYLEAQQLVFTIAQGVDDAFDAFESARDRGTMNRMNDKKTWKQTCEAEREHIRLPPAPLAKATEAPKRTTSEAETREPVASEAEVRKPNVRRRRRDSER